MFHPEATGQFSDDRLLREAGAVVTNNGEAWFTLPGGTRSKRSSSPVNGPRTRLASTIAERGWTEERALEVARFVLIENPKRVFARDGGGPFP